MKTDIATRLRSLAEPGTSFDDVGGRSILRDAADEIDRLVDLVGWAGKNWQETHSDLTKATRWIPVEERLPEGADGEYVLVTDGNVVGMATHRNGWSHAIGRDGWTPTHWMPLPEPPEVK